MGLCGSPRVSPQPLARGGPQGVSRPSATGVRDAAHRTEPRAREQDGAFGGTYFRPIRSHVTGETYEDVWKEVWLPPPPPPPLSPPPPFPPVTRPPSAIWGWGRGAAAGRLDQGPEPGAAAGRPHVQPLREQVEGADHGGGRRTGGGMRGPRAEGG